MNWIQFPPPSLPACAYIVIVSLCLLSLRPLFFSAVFPWCAISHKLDYCSFCNFWSACNKSLVYALCVLSLVFGSFYINLQPLSNRKYALFLLVCGFILILMFATCYFHFRLKNTVRSDSFRQLWHYPVWFSVEMENRKLLTGKMNPVNIKPKNTALLGRSLWYETWRGCQSEYPVTPSENLFCFSLLLCTSCFHGHIVKSFLLEEVASTQTVAVCVCVCVCGGPLDTFFWLSEHLVFLNMLLTLALFAWFYWVYMFLIGLFLLIKPD